MQKEDPKISRHSLMAKKLSFKTKQEEKDGHLQEQSADAAIVSVEATL